jgi:hypothetical protein
VAAVGRSVGIVGRIADSAIVLRLTRGRLWIGLLGTLLVGIVGLNVVALSFSATASNTARDVDELKRLNSAARANLAGQLSSDELHHVATKLGLVVPAPNRIAYLEPSAQDARIAAERIRNGELVAGPVAGAAVADTALGTAETLDATTPVATTTPVDPATTPTTDPTTTAPTTTAPTTAAGTAAPAGGLAAP